jgi:hypothetical protein
MPMFRGIATSKISNGASTLFWKDSWTKGIHHEHYPRAFSFAINEDVSVQNFLVANSLGDNFYLPLSPEALEEVRLLQHDCSGTELTQGNDTWSYAWGDNYTSSDFYKFCFKDITPHPSFLWIWKSKCVPKMKFFCWLVLSDRLNTRNMLRRRKFNISTGYECLLCDNPPEETIEHLIFTCPFSTECWDKIGFVWNTHGNRLDFVQNERDIWDKPMFMEIFIIAAWNIWKERNNLFFNKVTPSRDSWLARFKIEFGLLKYRTKEKLHPFINTFISSL